jgi:hypothetical protein
VAVGFVTEQVALALDRQGRRDDHDDTGCPGSDDTPATATPTLVDPTVDHPAVDLGARRRRLTLTGPRSRVGEWPR